MTQKSYIRVSIPQRFDFERFGIFSDEGKIEFLERICKESNNQPILRDNKPIGIIQSCEINADSNSVVYHGAIWCYIGSEFTRNEEIGFSLSALVGD